MKHFLLLFQEILCGYQYTYTYKYILIRIKFSDQSLLFCIPNIFFIFLIVAGECSTSFNFMAPGSLVFENGPRLKYEAFNLFLEWV